MKLFKFTLLCLLFILNFVSSTAAGEKIAQKKRSELQQLLERCARTKLEVFRLQLRYIKDVKFLEQQLNELRNQRLKIRKEVERLELMTTVREKQNQRNGLGLVNSKENQLHCDKNE